MKRLNMLVITSDGFEGTDCVRWRREAGMHVEHPGAPKSIVVGESSTEF